MKPLIIRHCGDAMRTDSLHGEPRADHRRWMQIQVHVLPEGREPVVQGSRQGPPASMASAAHIMCQVCTIRVHLHRCYKHIV